MVSNALKVSAASLVCHILFISSWLCATGSVYLLLLSSPCGANVTLVAAASASVNANVPWPVVLLQTQAEDSKAAEAPQGDDKAKAIGAPQGDDKAKAVGAAQGGDKAKGAEAPQGDDKAKAVDSTDQSDAKLAQQLQQEDNVSAIHGTSAAYTPPVPLSEASQEAQS